MQKPRFILGQIVGHKLAPHMKQEIYFIEEIFAEYNGYRWEILYKLRNTGLDYSINVSEGLVDEPNDKKLRNKKYCAEYEELTEIKPKTKKGKK